MNERENYTDEDYRDYLAEENRLGGKSPEELEAEIDHIRQELHATLREIESRFSPSELFDRAWHYVRGGPSDFVSNLGHAIKVNPIPAALMGISLGWLMISREERPGPVSSGFTEKGTEAAGRIRGKARDISHRVGETMHRAGERLHTMGEKTRHQWEDVRQRGRERAAERIQAAEEKAHETREGLGRAAHRYGERMQHVKGGFSEAVNEQQPLLLGALGIAAGVFLGALLPKTRQEDEWFGRSGERLRKNVQEGARENMEKAKHVAGAAVAAAREEASRQLH